MMFDDGFDDDGGASSSGSSRVNGVVGVIVRNARLIDGGKVVSPTHQPHFTPQKHYYFNVSGTNFC
jgi:hypothetical protein